MKILKYTLPIAGLVLGACVLQASAGESSKKSAADVEKEKALASPYPNDLGPDKLDDATLKSYPADIQEGYKLLLGSGAKKNCQSCHSSARPLNSRFLELPGKDQAEREAAIAKLKASNPEVFKDKAVWQAEWNAWNRYVKRMMAKPGCNIDVAAGKKIWEFLVYDGSKRKVGANAEKWRAHRKKLVADFKAKYPKRYEELEKDNDL